MKTSPPEAAQLGGDPADGSLFLFVNKRRERIKSLWWDGDGFVLWYKRLEEGTFETLPSQPEQARVRIDSTQLAMILGGVRLATYPTIKKPVKRTASGR
ncbi:MAG: IS66 family insertion sequence element accessory protein TnpB [Planctomycetota bacterium]